MELLVTTHSEDHTDAVNAANLLKKDINFFIPEVTVKQLEKKLEPDDAGISIPDVAVRILFGNGLLTNIIEIIKTWIEKRVNRERSKIHLELKDENGKTFILTLENIQDLESTIESLKSFTKN
jgi:hypothetical protein